MIVLAVEYPCRTCGTALRICMPVKPPSLPVKLDGVVIPALRDGWTYDGNGVHCPSHPVRLIQPVTVAPDLSLINGRKH